MPVQQKCASEARAVNCGTGRSFCSGPLPSDPRWSLHNNGAYNLDGKSSDHQLSQQQVCGGDEPRPNKLRPAAPSDRAINAEPRTPFGEDTVLLYAMHGLGAEKATTEQLVLDNLFSMRDSMQPALAGMHRDLGTTMAETQRAMQREIAHWHAAMRQDLSQSLAAMRHDLGAIQQDVDAMQQAMLLDRVAAQRDLTAMRSDLTAQIQLAACRCGGNPRPSAAVAAGGAGAATHQYIINPDDVGRGLAALRQRSALRAANEPAA